MPLSSLPNIFTQLIARPYKIVVVTEMLNEMNSRSFCKLIKMEGFFSDFLVPLQGWNGRNTTVFKVKHLQGKLVLLTLRAYGYVDYVRLRRRRYVLRMFVAPARWEMDIPASKFL